MCSRNVLVWLPLLAASLVLLGLGGAFQAEFGDYPDEPGHFVTSLMVRDYVSSGLSSSPMQYAVDYYLHYPKVALGHYPPLLYVVQAAWMLVFPATRASLLVLNAVLVSLTGILLYRVTSGQFGRLAGIGIAFLWVALPQVQANNGLVMAEVLAGWLVFGAVVCYGRYLDNPSWRNAAAFGLLAALAILTKQLAVLLALVPVIATPLARRLRLVVGFSFWIPALLVAGLAGPWYVYVHSRLLADSVGALSGRSLARVSVTGQVGFLVQTLGYAALALCVVGLWAYVVWPALRGRPVASQWAAHAALLLAFVLSRYAMHALTTEARYLFVLQPSLLLFSAAGVAWLARHLARVVLDQAKWAWTLATATGLAFALWTFQIPRYRYFGFSEAALVLKDPARSQDVSLVCADAGGEGAFVAAVAAGDRRPGHFVLRANKALAFTTWNGISYQPHFATTAGLQRFLESVPVRILVVQKGSGPAGHTHWGLLKETLRAYPHRWTLVGSYPRLRPPSRPGAGVDVYFLEGVAENQPVKIPRPPMTLRRKIVGR